MKKVGGVKIRPGAGNAPPAPPASVTLAPGKTVGGIKPQARTVLPSCCHGRYVDGLWIHDHRCVETVVLWKAHGWKQEDWRCADHCKPLEMSGCFTHAHDCPWWDRHPANVPFGLGERPKPLTADEDDDLPF